MRRSPAFIKATSPYWFSLIFLRISEHEVNIKHVASIGYLI